jgi:hypothetical protein
MFISTEVAVRSNSTEVDVEKDRHEEERKAE